MRQGIFLVFCLCLVFSFGGWADPSKNLVPEVIGLAQGDAITALSGAGLAAGTVVEHCGDADAGVVIATVPDVGNDIPVGTAVVLVVSNGTPCFVNVPDLVGLTEGAASTVLSDSELTVGTISQGCSNTVPVGQIIGQCPPPGTTVQPGTLVNYLISTGNCPVQPIVPNVVGLEQSAAAATLQMEGLSVGSTAQSCSNSIAAGTVMVQFPPAGSSVPTGTSIYLLVSNGSCHVEVQVPNVGGQSQAQAANTITAAGLSVGAVTEQCSDTVPAGQIISQSPAAGALAGPMTSVHMVISTGSCPTFVIPDVVGTSYEAAVAAVAVNFNVGSVVYQCNDTLPTGQVLSQDPPAGSVASQFSTVNIVVTNGRCPVAVPDVVGQSQAAAGEILTAAELSVGTVSSQCSDTIPAGQIMYQNPSEGSMVAPGTAVGLTVSTGEACPKPPVAVMPNVVGMPEENALDAIEQSGFSVGQISRGCSDTAPIGHVIYQSPDAGVELAVGAAVNVTVSEGICNFEGICRNLRQNFDRYDTDNDGQLSLAEIQVIYPAFSDLNYADANPDGAGGISNADLREVIPSGCSGFEFPNLFQGLGDVWGVVLEAVLALIGLILGVLFFSCATCW